MRIMFRMASDPRMGPVTFLMPDEEAVKRIDFEDDAPVPPEFRDQCIGLLLDQMIIGKLPPPVDVYGEIPFSTLGGATATLTVEDGGLVLTDTAGRKVGVSDPVIDGPKLTMRQSNDLLMWDEWAWDPGAA